MEPGKLRHRIQVQSRTTTVSSGDVSVAWATKATVWAEILPLSGREAQIAAQIHATATHKVRCRYMGGVTPSDRIMYGARILEINAVVNVGERKEELEFTCTEVVT